MSEHVIVSGATGFLGATVVRELRNSGIQVTALVRSRSDRRRISDIGGLDILEHEVGEDISSIVRERKPSTFIHCAWRGVAGSERNETFQVTENVPLTIAAVDLAAVSGCTRWIGLGSQAEYGNPNRRVDEAAPLVPTTEYGLAKVAAFKAAREECQEAGMEFGWLRIFSTYGPDDSPGWFIPTVIQEMLAGQQPKLTIGEQLWDYLYVSDAASAVVAMARSGATGAFNVGSGSALPLRYYVEAIRREIGTDIEPAYGAIPYRPDQVMHLEADISRLVEATGWTPKVKITEGIRNTVSFERRRLGTATSIST